MPCQRIVPCASATENQLFAVVAVKVTVEPGEVVMLDGAATGAAEVVGAAEELGVLEVLELGVATGVEVVAAGDDGLGAGFAVE